MTLTTLTPALSRRILFTVAVRPADEYLQIFGSRGFAGHAESSIMGRVTNPSLLVPAVVATTAIYALRICPPVIVKCSPVDEGKNK